MQNEYGENLFEHTKMSFGAHLNELRAALFKSLIALTIGTLFGLLFGKEIVQFLQGPIRLALQEYHVKQVVEQQIDSLRERGITPPQGISAEDFIDDYISTHGEQLRSSMMQSGLYAELVYVDPEAILAQLHSRDPQRFPAARQAAKEQGKEDAKTNAPSENTEQENEQNAAGQQKQTAEQQKQELATYRETILAELTANRSKMIQIQLWKPLAYNRQLNLTTLTSQEAFMIFLKASLVLGILLASPFVFYFIWNFVAAGLYPHEKHYVRIYMPISILLFAGGASLAFFFVFKYVLSFLLGFNEMLGIEPDLRISYWMTFVLFLPIGFGISFQLPLVMLFLERIGVFNIGVYLEKWRIAVVVISILSMILTPADPMSMLLMFVPLTALYFAGIAFCRYMPRGRNPFRDPIE